MANAQRSHITLGRCLLSRRTTAPAAIPWRAALLTDAGRSMLSQRFQAARGRGLRFAPRVCLQL